MKLRVNYIVMNKVKKGKVVPEFKWGSGYIDPHFLDLGPSWR
jgi:hypothetical protein